MSIDVKNESNSCSVSKAIYEIAQGKTIVVVDDFDRENEGDLIIAAEKATHENINFMMTEGKGLICLALSSDTQTRLGLNMQAERNTSFLGTNFTESINLKSLGMSGITAIGRTKTILAAIKKNAQANDFEKPGFVFPLRAVNGGVLKRRGQTEASVDLARLAGLEHAGVICEIMGCDGEMLRGEKLYDYCAKHNFTIISVQDIVEYRIKNESLLSKVAENIINDVACISSEFTKKDPLCSKRECDCENNLESKIDGPFKIIVYRDEIDDKEHFCIIKGTPTDNALVRIHSECLTGDVFGSMRCDCGHQLKLALSKICDEKNGIIVYLFQEGRGIGFGNKLKAYKLQDMGLDTVEANIQLGFPSDCRNYRVGAHILHNLGIKSIRLMTNNPLKVSSMESLGIKVIERIPIISGCGERNIDYMLTKREKMGHVLPDKLHNEQ